MGRGLVVYDRHVYYQGERGGFSFRRYNVCMDENTWTLEFGFGGCAKLQREGYLDPFYRFQIRVEWRPLATCFEWWCELLCVETQWHHRGYVHDRVRRGAVIQYRIHSFRRWPVAVQFFSAARNVYDDHKLVDGDEFWRCDHGLTGFAEGFYPIGCWRCAVWRPITAARTALERMRSWLLSK